jgi:hypothetical protein
MDSVQTRVLPGLFVTGLMVESSYPKQLIHRITLLHMSLLVAALLSNHRNSNVLLTVKID